MKIVHVTTVHSRYDVRIFQKECITLANEFGDVNLFVCDGLASEFKNGVHIMDIGAAPTSRLLRIFLQPIRMFWAVRKMKPDIIHFHDPELMFFSLLLEWIGFSVIYDSHEDVPRQILGKHWIPKVLRNSTSWLFERIENFVISQLSGVVAATPHITTRFRRINRNIVNINNYPQPDELAPSARPLQHNLQICYVGGISRIRGIRPLIEALSLLPGVRLALCGRFIESDLEIELRALPGWNQVDYYGQVGRNDVRHVLNESMAGMVTLFPAPNYLDSLPIKMFEYMAAGIPVIASDFPLWRQILGDAHAGICVDPQDPRAIARAVRQLMDDMDGADKMGKAGREAVLTKYNWSIEGAKLTEFYKELT